MIGTQIGASKATYFHPGIGKVDETNDFTVYLTKYSLLIVKGMNDKMTRLFQRGTKFANLYTSSTKYLRYIRLQGHN